MAVYTYDYSWGSGPSQLGGPNVVWVFGSPVHTAGEATIGAGQTTNVNTATTGTAVPFATSPGAPPFTSASIIVGVALVFITDDPQAGDSILTAPLLFDNVSIGDLGAGVSIPSGKNELVLGGPTELWGRSWVYADRLRTNYQLRLQSGAGASHTVGVNGALTRYYVTDTPIPVATRPANRGPRRIPPYRFTRNG